MRTAASFLGLLVLLAACGGGGGGVDEPPREVLPLATNSVAGLTSTYRAVFDCTGRVSLNGTSLNVSGSLVIQSQPGTVVSPVNGLSGRMVENFVRLGALGQEVSVTIREFVHVDAQGHWWSLGGEDENGTRSWWSATPATYYPLPVDETVQGRLLNQHNALEVGDRIDVPPTDALTDDLASVLFTRENTREVLAIEVVDTPLARFECYRVESSETVDPNDGSDPITVDYVRWERPELGVVAGRIQGISFSFDGTDVVVERLDAVLTSHTP